MIFNFWFIWSFAASACGRHRKIRTQKKNFWHSGYSGRQKKYWTNVKTTPNMDRVMGTWFGLLNNRHMIKNKELEFKHRWYILQQTREDTLAFLYLYRKVRREVDILQSWGRDFELILGQIVSMREELHGNTNLVASCYIEKKHDSFPVDVRRLKTFLLKPCRNICITGKRQILISFQNLRSFSSWCVKYHNKRNRSAYKLWNPGSVKHSRVTNTKF